MFEPGYSMLSTVLDESTIVYIALILVCAGLLFAWRRTRKWRFLAGTGAGFILVLAFAILTHLVVTDRQKIERAIKASALAVEQKDLTTIDRTLAHDFHYYSTGRKEFLENVQKAMQNGNAKDVQVWDIAVDALDKEKGTAHITFMAKPHGNWSEATHFRVEGNLVREQDGEWRLLTFEIFEPFVNSRQPYHIPGM
jgi:hypothetical protein